MGPNLLLDYYNSYVIHPMYVEVLEVCEANKFSTPVSVSLGVKRMQRFNTFIERLISPEGTYPAFWPICGASYGGISINGACRIEIWFARGPENGQIRKCTYRSNENMFSVEGNFDNENFLKLGFVGHQPNLANYYTNNGSLYMTSFSLFCHWDFPLADHPLVRDKKVSLKVGNHRIILYI